MIGTYLDLDQLFYAVDNEDVLGLGLRVLADDGLITSVHPSVPEGLLGGLVVVQIA